MNNTIELLKEKIRVEHSDMEDNITTIVKHGEILRDVQKQILDTKTQLSN